MNHDLTEAVRNYLHCRKHFTRLHNDNATETDKAAARDKLFSSEQLLLYAVREHCPPEKPHLLLIDGTIILEVATKEFPGLRIRDFSTISTEGKR